MQFRRSFGTAVVLVAALLVPSLTMPSGALTDDFETDFWLPFTHFNLGDRAVAGYSSGITKSGIRSYHVGIEGWRLRDFGSAYGYALYVTQEASITELRVALFYETLADESPSPWDAFAAGVEIQLLDASYRALGRYRYITAYRPSQNAGRCGPSTSDIVLDRTPEMGSWRDLARNPAADFPAAPWRSAQFAKIAVGFLCAAGLTGASYSLYFDDFASDTDAGDSDRDGLGDLEEETRIYLAEVQVASLPTGIQAAEETTLEVDGPSVDGIGISAALELDIEHTRVRDLAITASAFDGATWAATLLWDPGFHARGAAILFPAMNVGVRNRVDVYGKVSDQLLGSWVHLYVDGIWAGSTPRSSDGSFTIPWQTDDWPEGSRELEIRVADQREEGETSLTSPRVPVIVDRTAPQLVLQGPLDGATLSGLILIEAQAADANAIAEVELRIDGMHMESRHEEPYTFAYETLDLTDGAHLLEVRALDPAGNEATRSVQVDVNNQAASVPPPCLPSCSLSEGTSSGNLPPLPVNTDVEELALLSGNRLRLSQGLRVPWSPVVLFEQGGVHLVLNLLGDAHLGLMDGLVGSTFTSIDVSRTLGWRISIRDYGSGDGGSVTRATISLAARTSPGSADTDSDGIIDAIESTTVHTSPILRDTDLDRIKDGLEPTIREIPFVIDRVLQTRRISTNPLDPDTDDDRLADGAELSPGEEVNLTDPTVADTDEDILSDGAERLTYGSDPTLSDTDGEGLDDGYETLSRSVSREVNGVLEAWTFTTSPILADTDDDRLTDYEEEQGLGGSRLESRPDIPDTDEDGLTDYEELRMATDGFETNARNADSDGDGVWDTFDKLPNHEAHVDWKTEYPRGLVRFEQEMLVFSLKGIAAAMWRYDIDRNECVLVSDETELERSTKSSVVTDDNVVASINDMFANGGEDRYEAVAATEGDPSWSEVSIFSRFIGSCGETPNQYYIAYETHRDAYRAAFWNREAVTVQDENGVPYAYTFSALPVDLGQSFSIILLFSIKAEEDRTFYDDEDNWLTPSFSYVIFGSPDFASSPVLHSATVFATDLNEHAYRVELRIPGSALSADSVATIDGTPTIGVYFGLHWFGRNLGSPRREALDPSTMRVASISAERPSIVSSLAVRLDSVDQEKLLGLVDSLAELRTDYYGTEAGIVYVFRTMDSIPFDSRATNAAAAILLVSDSEDGLFGMRETIDWGPVGKWYRTVDNPWGDVLRAYRDAVKIVRSAVVVSHFIQLLSYRYADPGTYILHADPQSLILVEKGAAQGDVIYTVSQAISERDFLFEVTANGEVVVQSRNLYRITDFEITTDLETSKLVGSQYARLKGTLRALGAAATLVTNGREAVIAFQEGNELKGLVYTSNGAVGVLGVFQGEKRLVDLGLRNPRLASIRLGTLAVIVSGTLMAALELHLGLDSATEMDRRGHLERAVAWTADTALSVIPIYGSAIMLSWSLTSLGMSIAIPNQLAAKITSSPGATIVFLFEYFVGNLIPTDVAKGVLNNALDVMVAFVQNSNGVLGIPAVPIFP